MLMDSVALSPTLARSMVWWYDSVAGESMALPHPSTMPSLTPVTDLPPSQWPWCSPTPSPTIAAEPSPVPLAFVVVVLACATSASAGWYSLKALVWFWIINETLGTNLWL